MFSARVESGNDSAGMVICLDVDQLKFLQMGLTSSATRCLHLYSQSQIICPHPRFSRLIAAPQGSLTFNNSSIRDATLIRRSFSSSSRPSTSCIPWCWRSCPHRLQSVDFEERGFHPWQVHPSARHGEWRATRRSC